MIKSRTVYMCFRAVLCVFTLFMCVSVFAVDLVSIYDIQFTNIAGFDGTYPSPYLNQTVMVQGVVVSTGFENGRIFISEPQGGAWSSLAVDGLSGRVSVGNFIELQGRVSEVMGMTVLTSPKNLRILLRSFALPEPTPVSVQEALTSEAFESVLVRITSISCKSNSSMSAHAVVEDGVTSINIGNGFNVDLNKNLSTGVNYSYIVGHVNFSYGRFTVHPRNVSDMRAITKGTQASSWGKIKSLYR